MKGYRRANFLLSLFYTLNTVKQCTGCLFERNGREKKLRVRWHRVFRVRTVNDNTNDKHILMQSFNYFPSR